MELTSDDLKKNTGKKNEEKGPATTDKVETKQPESPEKKDDFDPEKERLKARLYDLENQNKSLESQLEDAKAEKRKPGITVVESDGVENRKKRPNSFGLSDLVLPPYTKNRIAIYQVINGDNGINPATGLPVEAFDITIPGQYTFYDRFEKDPNKKKKVIQNITGSHREIVDGKPVLYDDVEDIVFIKGWKHVDIEKDYPTYVMLELHPNNLTNKFRPSNVPQLFKRVDINVKAPVSQAITLELTAEAGIAVKGMKREDVLAFATSVPEIQTHAGRLAGDIKADLMRWAMNNPIQFYKLNKNTEAGVKITVSDAVSLQIIEYKPMEKRWVFCETEEQIINHTAHDEPNDRLVKFLNSEKGAEWYQVIQDAMKWWDL